MNDIRRAWAALALWGLVGAAGAQAPTKILVGVAPAGEFIAAMVAREQGFFKKRGLDVEVQIMPPGASVPGLQSGSLQVGAIGTPALLQTSDSGLDFVVVAGGAIASKTDTNYGIIVKTGIAIEKPQDFVGKKIGTPGLESFFHVLAREWFTINKVDYKKVTFVEVSFPQLSDAMKSGTVDAVLTTEPFKTRTIDSGVGTKFFAIAADLPDGLPPFLYVAKRDWAVANASVVKAFREALAEGIRFADANPDVARADYGKYVRLPPDALAKVRWNKMSATVTPQQLALWDDMMRRQGMLRNPGDVAKLVAP